MTDLLPHVFVTVLLSWFVYVMWAPRVQRTSEARPLEPPGPLLATWSHTCRLYAGYFVLVTWAVALGWMETTAPMGMRFVEAFVVTMAFAVALARRRTLRRAAPEWVPPAPGSAPATSRLHRLGRFISLCLAVEICTVGLYGWVLLQEPVLHALQVHVPAINTLPPSGAHVVLIILGFAYGQLMTGAFVSGLREGVSTWGTHRRWQYAASAFPVAIGFTLCVPGVATLLWGVTSAPSLAGGLALRAVLLAAGFALTTQPPAATIRTLKDLWQSRRGKHGPSVPMFSSPPRQAEGVI